MPATTTILPGPRHDRASVRRGDHVPFGHVAIGVHVAIRRARRGRRRVHEPRSDHPKEAWTTVRRGVRSRIRGSTGCDCQCGVEPRGQGIVAPEAGVDGLVDRGRELRGRRAELRPKPSRGPGEQPEVPQVAPTRDVALGHLRRGLFVEARRRERREQRRLQPRLGRAALRGPPPLRISRGGQLDVPEARHRGCGDEPDGRKPVGRRRPSRGGDHRGTVCRRDR